MILRVVVLWALFGRAFALAAVCALSKALAVAWSQ
ncbi:hypothetical protein M2163_003683 [Streptomyces sp. SAI-135]|nr:hypothetical protein [Streptomyces sp. SAI-090]MDH6551557.1 hypothetical protein [Streptomyces sp. SAI-041]MDH6570637.1 hypothetical protein [Streptomyces sp. SAI-117]MDH6584387.1 hypothetical protein [Streptomyces sp. SAI-133]MDH6616575.1 hypothetical protein [Streptomyces sp. SAI-135]